MRIVKNCLAAAVMLLCVAEARAESRLKFLVGTADCGYESNIFRAPGTLLDESGNRVPESQLIVSAAFCDYACGLGWEYRSGRHRLYLDQGFWGRGYLHQRSLNQYDLDLRLTYRYRVAKAFAAGLRYAFARTKKIGVTALGDELMQKFSYRKHEVTAFMDAGIAAHTDAELFVAWRHKSYDKDPAVMPLDAGNLGVGLNLARHLGSQGAGSSVLLTLRHDNRKYSDLIALDAAGQSGPTNPLRNWRYWKIDLGYAVNPSGKFTVTPYCELNRRKDLFADYYSYTAREFGMRYRYRHRRILADFSASYDVVKYDVKTAPGPAATDPLLAYRYIACDCHMNYALGRGIELNFGFDSRNRNTNTLDESRTTRRGYRSFAVMAGFTCDFERLLSEKRRH